MQRNVAHLYVKESGGSGRLDLNEPFYYLSDFGVYIDSLQPAIDAYKTHVRPLTFLVVPVCVRTIGRKGRFGIVQIHSLQLLKSSS